jgi:hypothetical protein
MLENLPQDDKGTRMEGPNPLARIQNTPGYRQGSEKEQFAKTTTQLLMINLLGLALLMA